jgi:hypothetical protein
LHPSLVFHELVKKLGNVLPVSPKDAGVIQRRMIRAGIRNPNALKIFYGSKVMSRRVPPAADELSGVRLGCRTRPTRLWRF